MSFCLIQLVFGIIMKKWNFVLILLCLILAGGSIEILGVPLVESTIEIKEIISPLEGAPTVTNPSLMSPSLSIQGFFPEPTVEIQNLADHPISHTGYGNDTLRFSVQFKPAQTAYYYAYASQFLSVKQQILTNTRKPASLL